MNNLPRGYVWRCIKDPTGMFLGGYFRWTDIKPMPNSELPYWDNGTAFVHILTGTVLVVNGQKLRKEDYARDLQQI